MNNLIVDEPGYKRWWLPDRRHQFTGWIYGSTYRWSVCDSRTNETRQSGYIDIEKPGWNDLATLAAELANKRYPAKRERELADYARSYRR